MCVTNHSYAQTTNFDFDLTSPGAYTSSTAVSGWTVSSQTNTGSCNNSTVWTAGSPEFSIVATPILSFQTIGTIANSPLGGSNVARLNNTTSNSSVTRIARTLSVTSSVALFQLAYAGIWEDGSHTCCTQAAFKLKLYDNLNNEITCPSFSLAGVGCPNVPSYSMTSGAAWANWQVKYADFTPFIGTNITIEIIANDCIYGDHFSTLFIDAKLGGTLIGSSVCLPSSISLPGYVNYCNGSSIASIIGPVGYLQYSWTAPVAYPISAAQASLSTLTLTNAVAGSVYTLNLLSPGSCIYTYTYILSPTSVSIAAIGSSSTCAGGASGSATVIGIGSGTGYNYTWLNSSNSVISTNSTIGYLGSGIYTVILTAIGSQSLSCGTASATTTVNIAPLNTTPLIRPFCGTEAYLSFPGGSNYQWYNNLSAISASAGGTAANYTVTSPSNGDIYRLSYISWQGCQDSLQITLFSTSPGSIYVTSNPTICAGASNGSVSLSILPTMASSSVSSWLSVSSTGTTSAFSSSVSPIFNNAYSTSNLPAGGSYSVTVFDGSCKYSQTFSVTPFAFNYTLSPSGSPTLCPGNSIAASITFTSPPSLTQYSYSWSPGTFLFGTTSQVIIITPTTQPGSNTTIVYTVVVTSSVANCPLTKTLAVTSINPATPTIGPIPVLCMNSPVYTITASPGSGTYAGHSGLSSSGIIIPMLCPIGLNTFTYSPPMQGTCAVISTTGSFVVNSVPYIAPSGNLSICNGQTTTLSLSGNSSTYTWNTASNNPSIIVSPTVTTSYTAVGTSSNGCNSWPYDITVTVVPMPTLSIAGNSICTNSNGTLIASGATTYTWSNGSIGPSLIVPSSAGIMYTLTGANSQTCINTATVITLSVPAPVVTVSGNTTICEGQSTTLLANGANAYNWLNVSTGPIINVTPTVSTNYIVQGTNINTNCSNTATINVTVFPNPVLSILGDTVLCAGESVTLTASGANSYNWSNGSPFNAIIVSPGNDTTYMVTGTNNQTSCSASQAVFIKVLACTGIRNQHVTDKGWNLYPNPSRGEFYIETEEELRINLFDELGKMILIKTLSHGKHTLHLDGFSSGIYLLKAENSKGLKIIKISKVD